MAKKALKKTAKVLGGLGAAYMLTDLLGPKVKADPVEAAKDVIARNERVERERVDRPPAPANPPAASAPEPSARAVPPVMSLEEIAKLRAETARGLRERENQIDFREQANREPAILKKGGAVKGWGKARGARAAKVY
jgi:hypothetical protein